ncbi:MAG: alpha/beta hydrolase-fold protein [Planctomycetia bacterium]|nr:alpha/beta hydrolase-fold protein [Planctomycetia bacterium]
MSNAENVAAVKAIRELTVHSDKQRREQIFSDLVRTPQGGKSAGSHPCMIFAPVHYEPGYSYPLIVWLHGSGADESQLFRIMPQISMRNYVAAAPRGLTWEETSILRPMQEDKSGKTLFSTYDWPESIQAISMAEERVFDSITRTEEKYNIHPERIVLAGFDTGGTMALRIASMHPKFFAGAISLGGTYPEDHAPLRNWMDVRNLPLLVSFGTRSKVLPSKKMAKQLQLYHSAGMLVSVRQYNAAQELTKQMLFDVNNWVMEHIVNI